MPEPVDPLTEALREWAEKLLKASVLVRSFHEVHLVEPGCICFTRQHYGLTRRFSAHTALLKEGTNGPIVYRVENGWPLFDAGLLRQGPLSPPVAAST